MSIEIVKEILQNEISEIEIEIEVLDGEIEKARYEAIKHRLYELAYEHARQSKAARDALLLRQDAMRILKDLYIKRHSLKMTLDILKTKGVELVGPDNSAWIDDYLSKLSDDADKDTE